jgi:hypothetical protein
MGVEDECSSRSTCVWVNGPIYIKLVVVMELICDVIHDTLSEFDDLLG